MLLPYRSARKPNSSVVCTAATIWSILPIELTQSGRAWLTVDSLWILQKRFAIDERSTDILPVAKLQQEAFLLCPINHDKPCLCCSTWQQTEQRTHHVVIYVLSHAKQRTHLNSALYGVHYMLTITPFMAQSWYTSGPEPGSIDHSVNHHFVIASKRDLLVTHESACTKLRATLQKWVAEYARGSCALAGKFIHDTMRPVGWAWTGALKAVPHVEHSDSFCTNTVPSEYTQ